MATAPAKPSRARLAQPIATVARANVPESPAPKLSHFAGFLDAISVDDGATGWAVDTSDLGKPVSLELCVGTEVVAATTTSHLRDDIAVKFGRRIAAGFRFGPETMRAVPGRAVDQSDEVFVRYAGGERLEAGVILPTAQAVAEEAQSLGGEALPPDDMDLEMLLDGLRRQAVPLARAGLQPVTSTLRGYIETLVVDPAGVVWFVGWMRAGHPPEFGGVLAEGASHPAAAAFMNFKRDDLPGDATGIMGILSTDWRPAATTVDLQFYFGPGGRFHLRAHTPLRIIGFKELLADYAGLKDRCVGDRHTGALQGMLAALESWLPGQAAGLLRYGTESSLDRVLLVPGLGCLAEGWIMSPMKRIEGLRMRVGSAVLTARPDTLYWKPRPDLLAAFPRSETMTRRAGFVGLFAGTGDTADLADPVLKIIFEGGSSANWDIASHAFRRLGQSATIEDALAFFPALQDEPFFPRFARAAIAVQRETIPAAVFLHGRKAGAGNGTAAAALIFVLPEDRSDIFLLFEEVSQHLRTRPQGHPTQSMIFVASAGANRADALWLFREFEAMAASPCTLMLVETADQALVLLPQILRDTGTDRFLFVGAGVFLTELGWSRVGEAVEGERENLVLFGIEPDGMEVPDQDASAGARCFAWSRKPLIAWSATASPFFGGYFRDNGLRRAVDHHDLFTATIRISRKVVPTRISTAVNKAVYAEQEAA